jgi:Autographiviridae endonuclease VII
MLCVPKTRSQAVTQQAKHYFTGEPCSKGHISLRHITGTCTKCQQEANKRWADRNPGEQARRSSAWQRLNPERAREKHRRWRHKKNGIPTPTRPTPVNCECCKRKLEAGRKTHLDHCHTTGKFRGWLCGSCNLGIGSLGDDIKGLELALAYLQRAI